MNPLAQYSTEALLNELDRRQIWRPRTKIIPCDECHHFKAFEDKSGNLAIPNDFNPCTKGHKLLFRMPDGHPDNAVAPWGLYRTGCRDRQTIDEI
jgi:hypothetical protein